LKKKDYNYVITDSPPLSVIQQQHDVYYPFMGVVYACAFSFMSKYLYQSYGPKPMTRVDINDNNQPSNNGYLKYTLQQ
jgi:hypothetical protein